MKKSELKEYIKSRIRKSIGEADIDVPNPSALTAADKSKLINQARSVTKKPKLGTGTRFANLSKSIQKTGKSKESANAIAASVGMKKYGKEKMGKMAVAGKKTSKK